MPEKVTLFVYDLSQGMARAMSMGLMGRQIDAIYHTSVVVFGHEFFYGQGIMSAIPGTTHHGQPMERIDMGTTEIPQEVFMEFMDEMRQTYTADAYHLLDNNCNNFSNDVCQFLVGKSIPAHITSLPTDFLSTPFGQSLRPMIENMFGPSRHQQAPLSVAAAVAAAASGSPAANALAANIASAGASGTAILSYATDLTQLQNLIRDNAAVAVFFTSATCPPCHTIAPIFDEMILLKNGQIKGVKVDVSMPMTQEIKRAYGIQLTPTFMFFLKGDKDSEFSGANQAELRSSIDSLIYAVHPAHPHARREFKNYNNLSGTPILFLSLDNLDPPFTKLRSLLTSGNGLSESELKQLDKIQAWLKKLAEAKKNNTTEPSLGELGATWKPLLTKIIGLLPYENQFPVLDIIRMLIIHDRVAEVYSKDGNLTLVKAFDAAATQSAELSKSTLTLTLRLACNAFGDPLLGTYVLSSKTRESLKHLLVNMLLSSVDQHRQTAASLAFNIGVKIAEARDKITNVKEASHNPPVFGGGLLLEGLEGDWTIECLSAIVNAIEKEGSEDILHRLIASVANFIYKEESFSGIELLSTLDLIGTLDKKMQQTKVINSENVIGLCKEVQDMIRISVAEQRSHS